MLKVYFFFLFSILCLGAKADLIDKYSLERYICGLNNCENNSRHTDFRPIITTRSHETSERYAHQLLESIRLVKSLPKENKTKFKQTFIEKLLKSKTLKEQIYYQILLEVL